MANVVAGVVVGVVDGVSAAGAGSAGVGNCAPSSPICGENTGSPPTAMRRISRRAAAWVTPTASACGTANVNARFEPPIEDCEDCCHMDHTDAVEMIPPGSSADEACGVRTT